MVDNEREKNEETSSPKHVPLDEKRQKSSEFQVTFFFDNEKKKLISQRQTHAIDSYIMVLIF